jgi:hypothetical protein
MGSSAAEIDQQIASTRDHLDQNLGALEKRAASGAKRVGTMAAIGLAAGLAVAGVTLLVIRKVRKPSLGERVNDHMPDVLTELRDDLKSRFGNRPFRVVITSGDAAREESGGSLWRSTARKVAPAIATTAASALMAQFMKRPKSSDKSG